MQRAGPRSVVWRRIDLTRVMSLAALLALLFLVATPVGSLILSSVRSTDTGAFTLENYVTAYWRWANIQALVNSLLYAGEVTVLSAVLAVPLAWGVSRTDMPGKGLIRVLTLGAFITPPLFGCHRLDFIGRAECRLVEPGVDGADGRRPRPLQYL